MEGSESMTWGPGQGGKTMGMKERGCMECMSQVDERFEQRWEGR